MYELTAKMRSIEDPHFSILCDHIGISSLTEDDKRYLEGRIVPCPSENDNSQYQDGHMAIIVVDDAVRYKLNAEELKAIPDSTNQFPASDE